jgi:prostamide/prostaglandin F2alpha synthase
LLKARDIRLIGVGLEEEGVDEFLEGKYFAGEVYVDPKKEQYRALAFKQFNICNIWGVIFSKVGRAMIRKARANGTPNNFKGNGFLTGGTLIVAKGGTDVILFYRQQELADHLENEKILAALGIDETVPENDGSAINKQPQAQECTDVCYYKKDK